MMHFLIGLMENEDVFVEANFVFTEARIFQQIAKLSNFH